ncbi:MAG: protein-methionine-sulfoxide reductase catalytic subunit MsrP [Helicobacteraceae bacterium]|nr:protein-methionine-sulfoxide reductase catalytic subunit MsrP [Helicobacteraceae bacterium]
MKNYKEKNQLQEKITPEFLFNKRREFLKLGAGSIVASSLVLSSLKELFALDSTNPYNLKPTSYEDITNYINFYEFSVNKQKAVKLVQNFKPTNWNIEVSGEVEKPLNLSMQDIEKFPQVDRIYRFRCVEAWGMVVPWGGIELRELIDFIKPKKNAKYVSFTTLLDKNIFKDQGTFFKTLPYPYVEVLRLDEALNPLTLLATRIYSKPLLPQNGAPIRLVVPWKYGFKSIKSIVKIEFLESRIKGTWEKLDPREYGFYANVNPNVSHPRWSQAKETKLGEVEKRDTLLFNGYEKEVGYLYKDLDLVKNF